MSMPIISINLPDKAKKKEKMEFSKKWLIACVVVSVVFTAASFVLSAFDKQPLETLSVAIIETLWGTSGVSFVGYALQNSARAFAFNKFGMNTEMEDKNSGN